MSDFSQGHSGAVVPPAADAIEELLEKLLAVVRQRLRMEVAFVGRVAEGRRYFEFVDSDPEFSPVRPGESDDVAQSYCGRVLSGQVPSLIADAATLPGVADLAVTWELPIGAHLSVPIVSPDGSTYGTLCCFSRQPNHEVSQRDVEVLQMFADVVGTQLEPLAARREAQTAARHEVLRVLDQGSPVMAVQPIVALATGVVSGYEALARFPGEPWTTEQWFHAARAGHVATELETAAVGSALALLPRIPRDVILTVNASASALLASPQIVAAFTGACASRLVLELTEHDRIDDQAQLDEVLDSIRAAGGRIAVDDAGSGYAGLQRILALRPEILKLDRTLVDGIADHPGRQAMCQAMVGFTALTGADLIAEGVETHADLAILRRLGVTHAQGYLLGRPRVLGPDELLHSRPPVDTVST